MPARQPSPHPPITAATVGQPTRDLAIRPTHQGVVEPYGQRERVVYIPSADNPNVMVAVEKRYVQPMQEQAARDLSPQPLLDPVAQRLLAAGVGGGAFAGGVGYGIGQILGGLAGLSSGVLFWVAVLCLAAKLPAAGRAGRGGDTYVTNNRNSWFGRSTTNN